MAQENTLLNQKITENTPNSNTGSRIFDNSSEANTEKSSESQENHANSVKNTVNAVNEADFSSKTAENQGISHEIQENTQENQANSKEKRQINRDSQENNGKSHENVPNEQENIYRSQENAPKEQDLQSLLFSEHNIIEFKRNFPSIDPEMLSKSQHFQEFLGLLIKNPTLSQVYSVFNTISASVEEKTRERTLQALANAKASPGSLSSNENQDPQFFTRAEVMEMSKDEIRKNLDVIRRSQSRW